MSFFNSLQQYVTSGVAGLGLSPRRFSLSRQDSSDPQSTTIITTSATASTTTATATITPATPAIGINERRESGSAQLHHGK